MPFGVTVACQHTNALHGLSAPRLCCLPAPRLCSACSSANASTCGARWTARCDEDINILPI